MKFEVGVNFDGFIYVEADNEEEAIDKVQSMETADIISNASGAWDIYSAKECEEKP